MGTAREHTAAERNGEPAAAVAEATAGLASDVHRPNVGIFSGATSVIPPAGVVADTSTLDAVNSAGVAPNVHAKAAPVETWFAMVYLSADYASLPRNSIARSQMAHNTHGAGGECNA